MSLAPIKLKIEKEKVGLVIGVSISGKLYQRKADHYQIDSARINNRRGAPLGYVGVWKLKALKP